MEKRRPFNAIISDKVYLKMKKHCDEKGYKVYKFVEIAFTEQIKREKEEQVIEMS